MFLYLINLVSEHRAWLLPLVLFVVYALVVWLLLRIFEPAQKEIDDR